MKNVSDTTPVAFAKKTGVYGVAPLEVRHFRDMGFSGLPGKREVCFLLPDQG